jgi:hypothetical protein
LSLSLSLSLPLFLRFLVPVPVLASGNKFRIQISLQFRNRIRKKLRVWIMDLYGVNTWKKIGGQKSLAAVPLMKIFGFHRNRRF